MKETLTRFKEWEMRRTESLLKKQTKDQLELPEIVEDIILQFTKKDYLIRKGVLTEVFLSYLDYEKRTTKELRKTTAGAIEKYKSYAYALSLIEIDDSTYGSELECIEIESISLLAHLNKRGVKRYSDLYNSRMLIEDYGEDILYCAQWKQWLLWDGNRWDKQHVTSINYLAGLAVKGMYLKAKEFRNPEDSLILMEHAGRSESVQRIEAMVRATAWNKLIRIEPDDLDRDDFIFNCKNGSIDLSSGRLLEHNRSHRITKFSPVEYDENAECPRWKDFLKSIFSRNKQLILYIQKILGMCLSGDVSAQVMFILYGTGANGKTTFLNTIKDIMGDYGANTPTETFMQKRRDSANNDIARLKGTRFVAATEGECNDKLAEAVVKRLTGNDTISARFLYGEFFEFIPTFKIFMATNHKPKISGMDNAIWRRIKLIPFEVSFNERQRDPKLSEKLKEELPGILAWMVEGCLQWQREGLGNPPAIMEATKEYRYEMSAIETFLQERCSRDPGEMTQASVLYAGYKQWAENNNEHIMSMRSFGTRLAETGLSKTRMTAGIFWLDIKLETIQ